MIPDLWRTGKLLLEPLPVAYLNQLVADIEKRKISGKWDDVPWSEAIQMVNSFVVLCILQNRPDPFCIALDVCVLVPLPIETAWNNMYALMRYRRLQEEPWKTHMQNTMMQLARREVGVSADPQALMLSLVERLQCVPKEAREYMLPILLEYWKYILVQRYFVEENQLKQCISIFEKLSKQPDISQQSKEAIAVFLNLQDAKYQELVGRLSWRQHIKFQA